MSSAVARILCRQPNAMTACYDYDVTAQYGMNSEIFLGTSKECVKDLLHNQGLSLGVKVVTSNSSGRTIAKRKKKARHCIFFRKI